MSTNLVIWAFPLAFVVHDYAFHRLFTDGLLSTDDVTTSLLVGAVLAVPIIVGARQLGKRLARS